MYSLFQVIKFVITIEMSKYSLLQESVVPYKSEKNNHTSFLVDEWDFLIHTYVIKQVKCWTVYLLSEGQSKANLVPKNNSLKKIQNFRSLFILLHDLFPCLFFTKNDTIFRMKNTYSTSLSNFFFLRWKLFHFCSMISLTFSLSLKCLASGLVMS